MRLRRYGCSVLRRHQVVAIGHAIVDELAHVSEDDLVLRGTQKGSMSLVGPEDRDRLRLGLPVSATASGGSAANTAAGLALMGASVAFVGRVGDDELGRAFEAGLEDLGVSFAGIRSDRDSTGNCVVMVTPDGERTMCTYLGAGAQLGPDDLDQSLVASASLCYLEGYLWDSPTAGPMARLAARLCREGGGRVVLSLSDAGCVQRHYGAFQELLDGGEGGVDIVFGNEDEMRELTASEDPVPKMKALSHSGVISVMTRAERGSVVTAGGQSHAVQAVSVPKVIDATGAGDLYAAGFLRGLLAGADLRVCARAGSEAASRVLGQMGARPEYLGDLPAAVGLAQ